MDAIACCIPEYGILKYAERWYYMLYIIIRCIEVCRKVVLYVVYNNTVYLSMQKVVFFIVYYSTTVLYYFKVYLGMQRSGYLYYSTRKGWCITGIL